MSDVSRGTSYEKRFQRFLEAHGYLTDRAPRGVVWIPNRSWHPGAPRRIPISKKVDFFGCIDVIGLHAEYPTVLAQVTTRKNRAERRKKVFERLSKILTPVLHADAYDVLVATWGRWEKRGYGFLVERLDRTGAVAGDEPTWEPWSLLDGIDWFISSREAP